LAADGAGTLTPAEAGALMRKDLTDRLAPGDRPYSA
jgi:hypothetical protein